MSLTQRILLSFKNLGDYWLLVLVRCDFWCFLHKCTQTSALRLSDSAHLCLVFFLTCLIFFYIIKPHLFSFTFMHFSSSLVQTCTDLTLTLYCHVFQPFFAKNAVKSCDLWILSSANEQIGGGVHVGQLTEPKTFSF